MTPNPAVAVLQTIIEILTGGITGIASAIGQGLSTLVSSLFFSNGELSTFASTMFIFMGITLAIGLCRYVLNWITSLGKK